MFGFFHAVWITFLGSIEDVHSWIEKDGKAFVLARYRVLRNTLVLGLLSVLAIGGIGLYKASDALNQMELDSGRNWMKLAAFFAWVTVGITAARIGVYVAVFRGTMDALYNAKKICGLGALETKADKAVGKKIALAVGWTSFVLAFGIIVPVYRNIGHLVLLMILATAMVMGSIAYWEKSPLAKWVIVGGSSLAFVFTTLLLVSTDLDRNVQAWNNRFLGSDAAQFNRNDIARLESEISVIRAEANANVECRKNADHYCSDAQREAVALKQAEIKMLQSDTESYWTATPAKVEAGSKAQAEEQAPAESAEAESSNGVVDSIGDALKSVGSVFVEKPKANEQPKPTAPVMVVQAAPQAAAAPAPAPTASNEEEARKAAIRADLLKRFPQLANK